MDSLKEITASTKAKTKCDEYIYNFVMSEEFVGKRFSRYVSKTKKNIEAYLSEVFEIPAFDFIDLVCAIIQDYMYDNIEIEPNNSNFGDIIRIHSHELANIRENEVMHTQEFDEFISNHHERSELYGCSLYELSNAEFINACKYHIRLHVLAEEGIDIDNYFVTLPECSNEILGIVENAIDWTLTNVRAILYKDGIRCSHSEYYQNVLNDDLKLQLEKSDEIKRSYENEITQLKVQNASYKAQLSELKKHSNFNEAEVIDENFELRRQLASMQKKYDAVENKYKNLLLKIAEENNESDAMQVIDEVKDSCNDIDYTKNYVFIADIDLPMSKNLLRLFPYASVKATGDTISSSTDLVIALTKSIKHSAYTGLKGQCKTKGIPFIHCYKTNIGCILDTIREYYNKTNNQNEEGQ